MLNFEFADNAKIRIGETNQLPITSNNPELYFMVIDQDNFGLVSYNCDIRGLNNLHRALSLVEEHENVMVLCNWHGVYQSHTFLCDTEELLELIKIALGANYTSELEAGLAY